MNTDGIHILIVDDDALVRKSLCELLSFEGHRCVAAGNGAEALMKLKESSFDILISDMKMPGMEGMELLRTAKRDFPDTAVIMITGFGSVDNAVAAMREGALDYITKPINDDEIKLVIKRIADERRLADENKYLTQKLISTTRQRCHDIIGRNFKMQKIYDLIDLIAATKTTVLITGESGTGKRVVAYAVHHSAPNAASSPFVEVSCGALPETLLESELFGHVKGAYTGAIKDRVGRFESAAGGTIFLDEIDAFTPALQVKLLRILQDGEYERVGETKTRKIDVRIIAATNQDLQELIKAGRFRNDLYYRLHIIGIEIPPLRERKEDIPLLAEHFIEKHSKELNKEIRGISNEAMKILLNYHWPGNVRELENVIERACVVTKKSMIQIQHLPDAILGNKFPVPGETPSEPEPSQGPALGRLKDALKDPERKLIQEALEKCNGNKKEAAKLLGINRTTLYKKLNFCGDGAKTKDPKREEYVKDTSLR